MKKRKLKKDNIIIVSSLLFYTIYLINSSINIKDIISYILYVICCITLISINEDIRKEEKERKF